MEAIKMEQEKMRKETRIAEEIINLLRDENFSVDTFNTVFTILSQKASSPEYLKEILSVLVNYDCEDIQYFFKLSSVLNKVMLINHAKKRVESLNLLKIEILRISEEYLEKASSSFEVFVYSSILRNEAEQYNIIAETSIRHNTPKFFCFVMDLIQENILLSFYEFCDICKVYDKNL